MSVAATPTTDIQDGRTRRGGRTRERLLTAAVELFGAKGFEATSMKDLAAAAGVQAPAIYNHFSSKEAVLAAAVNWAMEDFHHLVVELDDPTQSPQQRIEWIVRRHVLYQLEHPTMAAASDLAMDVKFLRQLLPPDIEAHVRSLMRTYIDLATGIIRQLDSAADAEPSDSRVSALAVLSLCDRVSGWYRPGGRYTPREVADLYWGLARGMLRISRTG